LAKLMASAEVDADGRPLVPASVKADIAKFLVEQRVGKAKVSVEVDSPKVWDFLQQFSGGLVRRDGSSYRPVRGQVIDAEPDDDEPEGDQPMFVTEEPATVTRLRPWEGPKPVSRDRGPTPAVTSGDDQPPEWVPAPEEPGTHVRHPRRR
jgi:hypothetical protein